MSANMSAKDLSLKSLAFSGLDLRRDDVKNCFKFPQSIGENGAHLYELEKTYSQLRSYKENEIASRKYPLHWAAYNANSIAFAIFLKMGYSINTRTPNLELHSTRDSSLEHKLTIPSIKRNATPLDVAIERLKSIKRSYAYTDLNKHDMDREVNQKVAALEKIIEMIEKEQAIY
jgi:hypothetical protein